MIMYLKIYIPVGKLYNTEGICGIYITIYVGRGRFLASFIGL